jgi:hypothetical protein
MMTASSDPLLQMSTLDLVEKLATTTTPSIPHRSRSYSTTTTTTNDDAQSQWLYSRHVIQPLLSMVGGTSSTAPDPFMSGPALRLLSTLAKFSHQYDKATIFQQDSTCTSGGDGIDATIDNHLASFHRILHNFDMSGGEMDRLFIVDAISSFASASSEALEQVLEDAILVERWLSLAVAQPKLKAVVLLSVARVKNPQVVNNVVNDDNVKPNSAALAMEIYSALGQCNNRRSGGHIWRGLSSIALAC